MKKKCLVISKEFKPLNNANINCLSNILEQMLSDFEIDVATYNYNSKLEDTSVEGGLNIYRYAAISDFILSLRIKFLNLNRIKKSKINWRLYTKPFFALFYLMTKIKGPLKFKQWGDKIKSEDKFGKKYDFILAIAAPFENVDIAYRLSMEYKVPLYILEFDLFTYSPTKKEGWGTRKNLQKEIEWYKLAKHVFITKEMEKIILKSDLGIFKDKITAINTPNFIPRKSENKNISTRNIDILYAGVFYNDIRNPKIMLSVFELLFKKYPQIKLHILGMGCEEIIDEYCEKWPNNLIVYGNRSKNFVLEKIDSCDILLNLSNKTTSQTPSKLIEYISSFKPIINFYSINADICKQILKDYNMSISLDEREQIDYLVNELADFIFNFGELSIDKNAIENKFLEYTPKFVASIISEKIGRT